MSVIATVIGAQHWNWPSFRGGIDALKWSRRDLQQLETALTHVPGRTAVIQAGGNIGIFPKYLAQEFTTVYTFEPDRKNFETMMWNAPERNIVKFQAALGVKRELVHISKVRRDGKPTNHEGIRHVDGPGTIPTLRIDDLALPVCDLIYLDIEGYELFALCGGVNTIQQCQPAIVLEQNRCASYYGVTTGEVDDFMQRIGYRHALALGSDRLYLPEAA